LIDVSDGWPLKKAETICIKAKRKNVFDA